LRNTDIGALGGMLQGEDVTETLAAVVKDKPDLKS